MKNPPRAFFWKLPGALAKMFPLEEQSMKVLAACLLALLLPLLAAAQ